MRRLACMVICAGTLMALGGSVFAEKCLLPANAWLMQVDDGPMPQVEDVFIEMPSESPDGVSDPNNPMTGQVENVLSNLPEQNTTAQQRDAAEDQLVALGKSATNVVRDAAIRHTGVKRVVAETAAFRLQNSIKPREVIFKWLKKNADGLKCKQERITAGLLGELFANHLFYAIEFGAKLKLPAWITSRVVLAIAADGKVQVVGTDAGLVKFMQAENGPATTAGDRGKIAEAVLVLAAAREAGAIPSGDEITTVEDSAGTKAEGAIKSAKVTVLVKFEAGKVSAISMAREVRKDADPPAKEGSTIKAEPSPDLPE